MSKDSKITKVQQSKIDAFSRDFTKEDNMFLVKLRVNMCIHADESFTEAVRATFESYRKHPNKVFNSKIAMSLWVCWSQMGNK